MHILPILAVLAMTTAAGAQTRPQLKVPRITGDIVKDTVANFAPGQLGTGKLLTPDQLWIKIKSASAADLKYAKALADGVASPGAKLRSACYGAWITTIEQSEGVGLKDAGGNPLSAPDPHVFSSFEQLAEVADALQPSGPLMAACAPVWTALKLTAAQFFTIAVSGAAGLSALGVAIP